MLRQLLTTCLILPCFSLSVSVHANTDALRVVTQHLQTTPLVTELELSGTLHSLHNAELSVAVGALVKTINAEVGDKIERGDILLELDDSLAKQEHQRALAQLAAADTTFAEAQRLQDEALKLKQQSHIAQSEVEARISAAKLAKARADQALADLRIAAENLKKHRLNAPFDGVISARKTELGQWANPGDAMFTLVSQNLVRLDVKLPQEHLANINFVKAVKIRPDTQPNVEIPAQIDALVPVGDESRSVLLRIVATENATALFPGASARAHLQFELEQSAVLLPRDALLRNADGSYSVFVVENGKAQRRKIALSTTGKDGYLIKEGLREGEQVVIRGNELLEDGQPVSIVDANTQLTSTQDQ